MPGPVALASLAYQTVWVVGITFLLWYVLMKTYAASKLSAFTFMTPAVWGGCRAHRAERADFPAFAVAVAFVIAGLFLVNRPRRDA